MADAVAVGAVLHAAGLELADHLGNVHGDGAELGVGHEATGAEDLTEAADLGHHRRGGDGGIEVDVASGDRSHEVVGTDDVGAGLLGGTGLLALGEDGDADGLAGAVGQGDGATNVLVGLAGVDAETEGGLDGLVKASEGDLLHELNGLLGGVELAGLDLGGCGGVLLTVLRHVLSSCGQRACALPHRAATRPLA